MFGSGDVQPWNSYGTVDDGYRNDLRKIFLLPGEECDSEQEEYDDDDEYYNGSETDLEQLLQ